MTLRNRLSVVAAVGVLIVVAAVSSVLYFSYAASLHSRVDATLIDAAQQASSIARSIKQSAADSQSPPDVSKPVTVGSVEIQLFLDPVAGQPTLFGPLDSLDVAVAEQAQPAYFADARDGGQQFRVYTAAMPEPGGGLVRSSRAANADDGALRTAALLLAALTVAAAGITYGAARLTAGRILRPIAQLTAAAEHVTQTRDLTARLDSTGTNDEVGRLASSFDTMLAALHESLTAQRQLVADASHELRTPLTSLTTNLDLLEDGAGVADPQAPALVRAAREQAGELDQLITNLLDLARYRESAPHRETVRLDLLTDEAVRRLRQRVPHAAIDTELHPCLVHVDPAAVDHAVSNLVDNAIKWTPPDDTVRVVVENGQVSVTDHGPGIADEDLPHIFERFYRAPAARGMPGAGLGLAIVGGVAHANKGTVAVQTGPNGSTFTLAFRPLPNAARSLDRPAGISVKGGYIPSLNWEPVSGIEPLACRLQEARPLAPWALAAPMALVIALTALAALGLSGAPFHEPFHADGRQRSMTVTERRRSGLAYNGGYAYSHLGQCHVASAVGSGALLLGRVAEPAQVELYPVAVDDYDDACAFGAGGHQVVIQGGQQHVIAVF